MSKLFRWAVDHQQSREKPFATFESELARFLIKWVFPDRHRYYVQANATEAYRRKIEELQQEIKRKNRKLDNLYTIIAEYEAFGEAATNEMDNKHIDKILAREAVAYGDD